MKHPTLKNIIPILPTSIGIIVLCVYPLAANCIQSIIAPHIQDAASAPQGFSLTLHYYKQLVSMPLFTAALANSCKLALVSMLCMGLSAFFAERAHFPRRLERAVSCGYAGFILCISGISAAAVCAYYIFANKYGLFSTLFGSTPLTSKSLFTPFAAAFAIFYSGTGVFLAQIRQKKLILPLSIALAAGTFCWANVFSPLTVQQELLSPALFLIQVQTAAQIVQDTAPALTQTVSAIESTAPAATTAAASALIAAAVCAVSALSYWLGAAFKDKQTPIRTSKKHMVSTALFFIIQAPLVCAAAVSVLWVLAASFSTTKALFSGNVLSPTMTIANYATLFSEHHAAQALAHSALYALLPALLASFPAAKAARTIADASQTLRRIALSASLAAVLIPPVCASGALRVPAALLASIDERLPLIILAAFRALLIEQCALVYVFRRPIQLKTLHATASVCGFTSVFLWNDCALSMLYITEPAFQPITHVLMTLIKTMRYSGSHACMFAAVCVSTIPPLILFVISARFFLTSQLFRRSL